MARTLTERMQDWRWWGEQALHMGLGCVAAGIMAVGQPIAAGALAGLWLALIREYDGWPVESLGDAIFDVAATVFGGLAIGLVVWAVA